MSMARPVGGGSHAGGKPATAARMYDYYLGGIHNFPADREAADAIIAMFPRTRLAAQVNRAFLRRTVKYLCEIGVRQFLDIGSGVPTEGNVHEIAQAVDPTARVVYVDIDPVAVSESQEMLEGNEYATAVQGDARDARKILEQPQVRKHLDFDQPIAVLLVAVMHFINDDTEARDLVRQLVDGVPPGSYLVMSHLIDETKKDFEKAQDLDRVHDVYSRRTATNLRMRTRAQLAEFFEGLEMVDPGIAWVWDWRPAPDDPAADIDRAEYDTATGGIAGGVGKRPAQ